MKGGEKKKALKSVSQDGCQADEITLKDVTLRASHREEAAGCVTRTTVNAAPHAVRLI